MQTLTVKPPNLWAVVSQEFARFTQEFHSNQSFTLRCRSCAHTDFVTVAAARGRGRVAGGCLRYGNWLVGVTMMCAAGRWLSGIALQIGCAGEHVLIRTNQLSSRNDVLAGGCRWWLGVRGDICIVELPERETV